MAGTSPKPKAIRQVLENNGNWMLARQINKQALKLRDKLHFKNLTIMGTAWRLKDLCEKGIAERRYQPGIHGRTPYEYRRKGLT